MRAGTILRVVGCTIFVAGLIGGILIITVVQAAVASYQTELINIINTASLGWGIAIYIWISTGFLACLIPSLYSEYR